MAVLPRALALLLLTSSAIAPAIAAAQAPPTVHSYPPPTAPNTAYHGQRFDALPKTEPSNAAIPYTGPRFQLRSSALGKPASEPTIGVTPRGVGFLGGAGFDGRSPFIGHSHLYRSTDGGNSWMQLDPGTAAQFGVETGNDLDPYIYVDPDTGRVFQVPLAVAGSAVNWSDDEGATWKSSFITAAGANDHQTVVSGVPPKDAKVPLPAPSDPKFPKYLYYCVNAVDGDPCSRSTDGGQSFTPVGQAYVGAEAAVPGCHGALMGQLSTDTGGRVFLPSGHCGFPEISVSEDAGTTWSQIYVSGKIGAADTHTAVAADRANNLYYTWFDPTFHHAWLATSTDHGLTWSTPLDVTPPGAHEVNYPAIAAGDAGHVVLTFPGTTVEHPPPGDRTDGNRPWDAYVAVSTNALDANPTWVAATYNPPEDPIHRGDCTGRCGGLYDFVKVVVSPQDGGFWAATADDCLDKPECNVGGRNADGSSNSSLNQGLSVREIGGPWLIGKGPGPSGPGGSPGTSVITPAADAPSPILSRLVVRRKRAGRGRARLAISFALNKAATATVRVTGLRRKRSRAPVRVIAMQRLSALRGANRLVLGRRLRRGRYRVEVRAVDGAGHAAKPLRRVAALR